MIINKVNINKNRSTLFRDLHGDCVAKPCPDFKLGRSPDRMLGMI